MNNYLTALKKTLIIIICLLYWYMDWVRQPNESFD